MPSLFISNMGNFEVSLFFKGTAAQNHMFRLHNRCHPQTQTARINTKERKHVEKF